MILRGVGAAGGGGGVGNARISDLCSYNVPGPPLCTCFVYHHYPGLGALLHNYGPCVCVCVCE